MLKRRAFTLVEVLVSVGIIALLTAVTLPTIRGQLRDARANAIIDELATLRNGILAYRNDIGKNPPSISYLVNVPTANVSTDQCVSTTNKLTVSQVAKWRGPYITRGAVSPGYVINNNETVNNALSVQTYAGFGSTTTTIRVQIDNVDYETAVDVDARIDGDVNGATPTTGAITYTAANVGGQTTVYYYMPLATGAC